MENRIEIPLSKLKMGLLFVGAMFLVLSGIYLALDPIGWGLSFSPEFIRVVGITSSLFFGVCLIFITKKLFSQEIGLVIDDKGITDNTSSVSVGLIEWKDIVGIRRIEIASNKMLLIVTDQPQKYIDRATNPFSKNAMRANNKMYGSPISIISNSLKMNFNELEELIKKELKKRKKDDTPE